MNKKGDWQPLVIAIGIIALIVAVLALSTLLLKSEEDLPVVYESDCDAIYDLSSSPNLYSQPIIGSGLVGYEEPCMALEMAFNKTCDFGVSCDDFKNGCWCYQKN